MTFSGLTVLATVLLAALTYRWQRDRSVQAVSEELRLVASLMQNKVTSELEREEGPSESLRDEITRTANLSQVRITVIDPDGNVVIDSTGMENAEGRGLENQKRRPEVVAALARGQAIETRQSIIYDQPAQYYAMRLGPADKPVGILRTCVRLSDLKYELEVFSSSLTMVAMAIALGASLLTYVMVRYLVTPLLTLGEAARSIAKGEYDQKVYVPGNDELSRLAQSFNQMSSELGTRLTELRDSDDRQAAVLGGMVEGVVAVDQRERVLFANPAAGKMFDFLPPSVEGRPLLEVIRDHELHQAVTKVLSTRKPENLEIEWEVDAPRSLSVQVTPLPGTLGLGAVIVMHDNTELRRLETIRQEFVANVSHELKTPLSSIMAYTETLLGGAIHDEENRDGFLRRIAEQGERLNSLIQDMLSLARIETAQQPFEIVQVPLHEVAKYCVEDYQPQAQAKQIELTLSPDLPECAVQADEEGLRVIMNNLVDNAVKYTPERGRVDVGWRMNEGAVRFEVSDTGPGIPKAALPRVFERFYRIDKARSRELGSTGLGLSIVKHLAQSFGGTVGVESQAGRGSLFWVQLLVVEPT